MTKLKIAVFNTQGGGVGDYRHWIPARALTRRGHDVWFRQWSDNILPSGNPWQFLWEKAQWADVVHTGYSTNLAYIKWMVAMRNTALNGIEKSLPIITDCDDDILHVPIYNTAFADYGGEGDAKRTGLWHLKNSDAVTVTMPELIKQYKPYARSVSLLPNCIDPSDWAGLPTDPYRANSNDVRIVFAGNKGRKGDLDIIREALEIVMRARPQVRLFFMGILPDWALQWMPSATDPSANRCFRISMAPPPVYRRIMCWEGFDIALAPVLDNEFNKSKSEIKVMEAGMFGAASVCSDWPTYAAVPDEAVLRAETTYEWKESLLALIDDPELRRRKAQRCRQWTLDERNIDTKINLWEDCYEQALARPVIGDDGEHMVSGLEALDTTGSRIITV